MNEKQCGKARLVRNIVNNYSQLEQSIVNQLYMANDLHGTTTGGAREDIWREMFATIVPKKFVIESSVFIIDSNFYEDSNESKAGVSREVDLAIIDETYTPYIFRYGKLKFVPIEAVAAVVECKSKGSDFKKLEAWADQISDLKTSTEGIARMAPGLVSGGGVMSQQAVSPLKIFCGLGSKHDNLESVFDFVVLAHKEDEEIDGKEMTETKLEIIPTSENETLFDWHQKLNQPKESRAKMETFKVTDITFDSGVDSEVLAHFKEVMHAVTFKLEDPRPPRKSSIHDFNLKKYEVYEKKDEANQKNISLLTFNFQLNQLLMIINNPPLFPHLAYVDMFNEGLGADGEKGGNNEG